MRIRWQDDAIADLRELHAYIARDNPQAAVRIAKRIKEAAAALREQPAMGRPGRVPDTRELVITGTRYIVAYRVIGDALIILRVLHGARRWPGQFE